jgi:hypothetical protein
MIRQSPLGGGLDKWGLNVANMGDRRILSGNLFFRGQAYEFGVNSASTPKTSYRGLAKMRQSSPTGVMAWMSNAGASAK